MFDDEMRKWIHAELEKLDLWQCKICYNCYEPQRKSDGYCCDINDRGWPTTDSQRIAYLETEARIKQQRQKSASTQRDDASPLQKSSSPVTMASPHNDGEYLDHFMNELASDRDESHRYADDAMVTTACSSPSYLPKSPTMIDTTIHEEADDHQYSPPKRTIVIDKSNHRQPYQPVNYTCWINVSDLMPAFTAARKYEWLHTEVYEDVAYRLRPPKDTNKRPNRNKKVWIRCDPYMAGKAQKDCHIPNPERLYVRLPEALYAAVKGQATSLDLHYSGNQSDQPIAKRRKC